MDEYRLLSKKYKRKQEAPYKKFLFSFVNQILICAVLLLLALIATKNKVYKDFIYQYLYCYNLSFAEIENLYNQYFGNLIPIKREVEDSQMVSSEKLSYESLEEVENGVRLKVGKGIPVYALESGLVVFVGEKEEYGTTLILEQVDGTEAWYVGVSENDWSIYDYVEKNSIIGTSLEDTISLYFQKKGESVDYKNYLS